VQDHWRPTPFAAADPWPMLEEKDAEIEALRAEIERLEVGAS
jgi:hypothetical protein